MSSEPAFTVTDKRHFAITEEDGECKIETRPEAVIEPVPAPVEPKKPSGSTRVWKSQGFMVTLAKGNQGMLVLGRGVGLRADGLCAIADWVFPPVWNERTDWIKEVRKRLNSFLGCKCTPTIPCEMHRAECPKWMMEDTKRLEKIGTEPLPEAIEILMKAEQARRSANIVIPR